MPLDKAVSEVQSTNLPKSAGIVVYCGGLKCPQSRMAAEKLLKLAYENVRANEGGLEEWKAAGLSMEKVKQSMQSSEGRPAASEYFPGCQPWVLKRKCTRRRSR
jgi:Rhodanese-like domain